MDTVNEHVPVGVVVVGIVACVGGGGVGIVVAALAVVTVLTCMQFLSTDYSVPHDTTGTRRFRQFFTRVQMR